MLGSGCSVRPQSGEPNPNRRGWCQLSWELGAVLGTEGLTAPVGLRPSQYLRDPEHPVLEAMDHDNAPKEDAWDSVSVLSVPEEQQMLPNTRHQGPGCPPPAGADSEL